MIKLEGYKGITLIALIITIIVMLILVGVTINVALNGGLFGTTKYAAEETEMAQLKEQAESIKYKLMMDEAAGKGTVTVSSLADAIYRELGKEKNGNIVVSKDGKYDIIVESNLNIKVIRHGETEPTTEVEDLVEARVFLSDDTSASIYFMPNAEKYYPELIEPAILKTVNMLAEQNFDNIEDMKRFVIEMEDSPFEGKTPEEVSIQDIVNILNGHEMSINEFMYRLGYFLFIETEEEKETLLYEYNRFLIVIFLGESNSLSDEQSNFINNILNNSNYNEMKQYIVNEIDEYKGRDPNTITFNEVLKVINNALGVTENNDIDVNKEFDNIANQVFNNFNSGTMNGDNIVFLPIIMLTKFPEFKVVQGEGIVYLNLNPVVDLNGIYNYTVTTGRYTSTISVDVTVFPWTDIYTETTNYIDANGQTAVIPKGFRVSKNAISDTVSEGLVIADENKNKFVWIPVSDEDYNEMIDSASKSGKLYDFSTSGTPSYRGLEDVSAHQAEFDAMCESVKKNKGFYIGVYETTVYEDKAKSVSFGSLLNTSGGYMCGSFDTLYRKQKNLDTNSDAIVSGMIWGCQWDRVMKFVHTGSFNVGGVVTNRHLGAIVIGQNTGKIESKNITALEGNYEEWTMEGLVRGGGRTSFTGETKNLYPAAGRHNPESSDGSMTASRMMMYIK